MLKIKKHINQADVVSFDIFDTLLLRPYYLPSDIFDDIEQTYSVPGFASARKDAEPAAWKDLVNNNKDDVTLDEIYSYMPKKFQSMKQKEIEFESSHLYVNPEMMDILNYALSVNKKVIIVSDMYLPAKELNKILIRELKTNKFKLYVSSEFGKRKHTGRLFEHVLQDLNIKPCKILHIGDNKQSDFEIPKQKGFKTYLYVPPVNKFINNKRMAEFLKWHNNLIGHRFIGTLSLMYHAYSYNKNVDYWDKFAFLYGGPLAYNYLKMIKDISDSEKISDICFVARDGYTLKKVFDLININKKIKGHYTYAPRFTNTLAYLDLGNKNVLEERKQVLLNFLKQEGVAKDGDTVDQHKDSLQKYANNERKEYEKYISSLKLGKKIGVVDSISMSFSAQKLITKNVHGCNVTGFYWWVVPAQGQKKPKLYQFYNKEYMPCFCHLIEFLFAAPEKPIYRIFNKKPVYKTNIDKYEQIKIDLYPKISDAITEFANIVTEKKLNPIILDQMMFDWINYFVMFANKNDFKQFKNIKNGVDQSHTKYDPVLPELPGFNKPEKNKTDFWCKFRHMFYHRRLHSDGKTVTINLFGIRIFKYKKTKRV